MSRLAPRPLAPTRMLAPAARGLRAASPVDASDLRPYQAEGVRWLASRDRALLADEMRLGKTVQALRALGARARAIVLCPAIVRLVWRDEARRWRPDLEPLVGELRAPRDGELVITSYDSLPAPAVGWTRGLVAEDCSRATLVLDEAHYVKGWSAARTRRARLLGRQCARIWALTGTPLVGRPDDLWGVLVSAGLAKEVFGAEGAWENFLACFEAREVRGRMRYGQAADWLRPALARVMLRRTRAQLEPDLPAVTFQDVPITAPDDLRDWLDELDERWSVVGHDRLPPFELLSAARAALARARIAPALEHVRSRLAGGGPVVVFSAHRDPVLAMRTLPRSAAIVGETSEPDRARALAAFAAGRLDVLALSIDAGGVGIDLSRADVAVFVDEDWTPGVNDQAVARLQAVGKRRPIQVDRLLTDHPIDRRVVLLNADKRVLIREVVG